MAATWKTAKLSELVKITIGRTPSRSDETFWDKDKNTSNVWLSIADLLNVDGKVVSDSKEYITNDAAKTFVTVPEGTLLVSFKLTLGRLAYAGRDLRTNEAIAALHNDQTEVSNGYLYHYLSRFNWNEYAKADQKVKGLTLNKAKLAEIEIIYPESLEEQRRIVAWLDAAFEKISAAEVLMWQNLDGVTALKRSILRKYLSASDNVSSLGELCVFVNGDRGRNYPSKSKQTTAGIPFINAGHLESGVLRMEDMNYISRETYDRLGSGKIKSDDILYCLRGSIGKFASVGALKEGAIASSLVIVRPDDSRTSSSFATIFFCASKSGKLIKKDAKLFADKFG